MDYGNYSNYWKQSGEEDTIQKKKKNNNNEKQTKYAKLSSEIRSSRADAQVLTLRPAVGWQCHANKAFECWASQGATRTVCS